MKQLQYRVATLNTEAPFAVYAEATIVTKEMRKVQAKPSQELGGFQNWETRIVDTAQNPELAR